MLERARIRSLMFAFGRRLRSALPTALGAVIVTMIALDSATLGKIESFSWGLDLLLSRSVPESKVVLVVANQRPAGQRDPFTPVELAALLQQVAATSPKAIGVMLDTSDPVFGALREAHFDCPVIWQQEAVYSERRAAFVGKDVLGGKRDNRFDSGISLLELDSDDTVRRYRRSFLLEGREERPAFARAVLRAAGMAPAQNMEGDRQLTAAGRASRTRLQLSVDYLTKRPIEDWKRDGLVPGRIVLVGTDTGMEAEYQTPFGYMSGLELTAWIIDTELAGGGPLPSGFAVIAVLALLGGIFLLVASERLVWWKSLLVSAALAPPVAVSCSLLAAGNLTRSWYFLLTTLGVVAYHWFDRVKDSRKGLALSAADELFGKALGTHCDPLPEDFRRAATLPRSPSHASSASESGRPCESGPGRKPQEVESTEPTSSEPAAPAPARAPPVEPPRPALPPLAPVPAVGALPALAPPAPAPDAPDDELPLPAPPAESVPAAPPLAGSPPSPPPPPPPALDVEHSAQALKAAPSSRQT